MYAPKLICTETSEVVIFTHTFLASELEAPEKQVVLEILDRSSKTVVFSALCTVGSGCTVELDGPKFDNKLVYRFVNQNTLVGLSPYRPLYEGGIAAALNRLDPGSGDNYDYQVLDGVSPEETLYLMRNILTRGYQRVLLKPDEMIRLRYHNFLAEFPRRLLDDSSPIQYVHQVLSLLVKYIERCSKRSLPLEAVDESVVDRMIGNYCRSFDLDPSRAMQEAGLLVAKGHLMSLSNRKVAVACYEKARICGSDFIENFLRVDALTTYFGDVPAGYCPSIVPSEVPDGYKPDQRNICFSVDPKYFKMYGPLWATTSAFYPEINFNYLIVTETREEFEELANSYQMLLERMYVFARGGACSNVRLFWMQNDRGYGRTLFACARFYLTQYLLENSYGDAFVCDIDQLVVSDIGKFLASTARADAAVQLAVVENYYALLPGRSHLAGYIYLKNSDSSRHFIRDVTDYIGHGLGQDYSWMLDQNAIRYGAELTPIHHLDMRSTKVFGHYVSHKDSLRSRLPLQ